MCNFQRNILYQVTRITSRNTGHRDLSQHWLIQWALLPQNQSMLLLLASIPFLGVCAKCWGGLTLASSQAATELLAHPTPQRDRGENRNNKSTKTYGLRYRWFNRGRKGKNKPKQPTSEGKETVHHIAQADQYPTNLQTKDTLEAKKSPFFFLYLSFYFCTHNTQYRISIWPIWVGCPTCVPTQPLAHFSLHAGQAWWEKERLDAMRARLSNSQNFGVLPMLF